MIVHNFQKRFEAFHEALQRDSLDRAFILWDSLVEREDAFFRKWNWHHPLKNNSVQKEVILREFLESYSFEYSRFLSRFSLIESLLKKELPFIESLFGLSNLPIQAYITPVVAFWVLGNPLPDTVIFSVHHTMDNTDDQLRAGVLHELFHAHHKTVLGKGTKPALSALWLEGLAEFVSLHHVGTSDLVRRYEIAGAEPKMLAKDYLPYADLSTEHAFTQSFMRHWFFTKFHPDISDYYKKGYYLGYHVVKTLNEKRAISEMCKWTMPEAERAILQTLHELASS